LKAKSHFALSQIKEAKECLDQSLQFKPTSPAYYLKSNLLYQEVIFIETINIVILPQKKFNEALGCCDNALAIVPDVETKCKALFNKASIFWRQGLYEHSIVNSSLSLEADPNQYSCWLIKANALNRLDRHEEAIVCYNRVISIKDNIAICWYNKGKQASTKK